MKKTITTLSLALTFLLTGKSQNNCLDFDGIDNYVSIPHSSSLLIGSSPYTLEVWAKAENINQWSTIVLKRQPSGCFPHVGFYTNDGSDPVGTPQPGKKITFGFGFAGCSGDYRNITTVNDIVDGEYHHLAVVVNPTNETLTMYIDGVLEPVNLISVGNFPTPNHTDQYVVGQNNGGGSWFDGQVDEVRIWNVVRTQTEIQNNMNIELSGSETGLVAYFKFNQGVAGGNNSGVTTLLDETSNNNVGTLHDFTLNGSTSNWVSSSAFLPVELIDFKGKSKDKEINLYWRTASELNNSGFEIQKSKNGRDWDNIDFIEGGGTATEVNEYQYVDLNPLSGINYYRLKQIDFDGVFEYSKVIAVEHNNSERSINVFPNPSNGLINLQINNPSNQRMKIKILDNLGRKVWEGELIEGEANWRKEIAIEGNGIYFVTAQIGDEIYYERVIITDEK